MAFTQVVHHMTKSEGSNSYRITRITPVTRLSESGEVVLLQGGRILDAGGAPLESPPAWAYAAMSKMSAAALKEVGFNAVPEKPAKAPDFLDPDLVAQKRDELAERRGQRRNSRGRE